MMNKDKIQHMGSELLSLNDMKNSIKLLVDKKQAKELYPKLSTNGNYPNCLQIWRGTPRVKKLGCYNEFYLKLDFYTTNIEIKFYSDFGMCSFNFTKFYNPKDNLNDDDIKIQKLFLETMIELREVGIIDIEIYKQLKDMESE